MRKYQDYQYMMKNSKEHKTALPELRFPEFRGAEGWEDTLLGKKVNFFKGKGLPKSEITLDGLNQCVHYGELFTSYSEVIHTIRSKTNLDNCFLSYSNDVLMPTSDVTPNGLAKACCINVDNVQLGGDILILRTDKSKINGEFLCRQIRHKERKVLQLISGSTVYHLYSSSIEKLNIAIPSINEQKKIAECFSSLDDLISAVTDKIEALKDHKKGLMQQLFPAEGSTVPARRFPEFQNAPEWKPKSLGSIGEIITGNTPATKEQSNYGGDRLFVSPADISNERYVSKTKTTLTEQGFSQSRCIKENSILFVCIGSTIGKIAQNTIECATNQQINSIVPYAGYISDFVYSLLEYNASKIASTASNQAVPIINKTEFSAVTLFMPKEDEQLKIADCLSSIDDQITSEQQKLEQLKAHKKGLMQRLFPKV